MKRPSKISSLALAVGCILGAPAALASSGPLSFLHVFSQNFFLHGSPGYLGVDLKNVDADRANALKLKDGHGVEIIAVDHDAPAAKAGLRVHDVIVEMNGREIDNCDQMRRLLRKQSPGRTVAFVVNRDGATLNVSVQLADRAVLQQEAWSQHYTVQEPSAASAPPSGTNSFVAAPVGGGSRFLGTLIPNSLYVGAEVNPLRAQLAEYFGVTSGTGLLVESVDGQSPAARAGLRAGDVILKVNDRPMVTRNDWLKAIRNSRGRLVQVTIMRNKQQQTLTMAAGQLKKQG